MAAPLTELDFTSLTPSEVLALADPPEEYTEFLKTFSPPPIPWHDPPAALATIRRFISLAEKADHPDPEVEEQSLHAPARDGYDIPLKIWRPAASTTTTSFSSPDAAQGKGDGRPLFLLFFGGGNIVGTSTLLSPLARTLVKRHNAVVVGPAYRLAPEYPFPASVNDAWDSFLWTASHSSTTLAADPEGAGFIVGGVSSGGTHSLVLAHLARDRGVQPPVTGLLLSCIGARVRSDTDLPEKYAARYLSRTQRECLDSPTTSPAMAELIQSSCQNDPNSSLFAPLFWPSEQGHRNLPRTYFQVCGAEVSRDEVLILRDLMEKDGAETMLHLYVGLPHVFWGSLKGLPQKGRWMRDVMEGVGWMLGPRTEGEGREDGDQGR